jgi:hypothetical protein
MNYVIYRLVDFLFGKDPFPTRMRELVFGNFLVPQESLMTCNIISKSGNDLLMFQNCFLIRIPYPS